MMHRHITYVYTEMYITTNVLHFILTKLVLGWYGDVRCGDDAENHQFPFDVTYVGYSRFWYAREALDPVRR